MQHGERDDLPIGRLPDLWPRDLGSSAREWVAANLHEGVVDDATFDVEFAIDPALDGAELVSVAGALQYQNLTINYFNGLPPVRKAEPCQQGCQAGPGTGASLSHCHGFAQVGVFF